MKKTNQNSWARRAVAMGLGLGLVGGMSLVAAPAQAVPATYAITGEVSLHDADGAPENSEGVYVGIADSDTSTLTDGDGHFSLGGLANGTYALEIYATAGDYNSAQLSVTILDADTALDDVVVLTTITHTTDEPGPTDTAALPPLKAGTAKITGTATVGSKLAATSTGWPEGTTLTYQWFYNCGQCGGPINDATTTSYTVTKSYVGQWIGVIVTGSMDGYEPTTATSDLTAMVTAPKKSAAPAPVATSSALAAYLAAHHSTPASQASVGLPTGSLDPNKSYTATVEWAGADSFVDVYLYSTPILVGTFPVVDGVARITLSSSVLGDLAAGAHTLVVVGQSSGAVQSVALGITASLAATGFEIAGPLTTAASLLMLGAGLVFVRRRVKA